MASYRTTSLLCCLCVFGLLQGTSARRTLQQAPSALPSLQSTSLTQPLVSPGLAPAPLGSGPGPIPGATCALQYLQSAGTYRTLIDLIEGSSEAQLIAQILESPDVQATLLAPTDSGILATASALGLSLPSITADPVLVTDILTYHILPSILQVSDITNQASFNTELSVAGIPRSVTVNGTGTSASFTGGRSSAAIGGQPTLTCKISIIPINGLLIP